MTTPRVGKVLGKTEVLVATCGDDQGGNAGRQEVWMCG